MVTILYPRLKEVSLKAYSASIVKNTLALATLFRVLREASVSYSADVSVLDQWINHTRTAYKRSTRSRKLGQSVLRAQKIIDQYSTDEYRYFRNPTSLTAKMSCSRFSWMLSFELLFVVSHRCNAAFKLQCQFVWKWWGEPIILFGKL